MTPHRAPLLFALVLALAGCGGVTDTVDRAGDCVGLARDVAAAGLDGTPSLADAEAALQRLDERVAALEQGEVRDAATVLRDRLRELTDAVSSGDTAAAAQAADDTRAAARDAAETCGVPVDQFLG